MFALDLSELAAVEHFLRLLVGNWFLMDYAGNFAGLPEVCFADERTAITLRIISLIANNE